MANIDGVRDLNKLQEKINGCQGLCIEIAGPSPLGYEMLVEAGVQLPKEIVVTNISNPIVLNPFGNDPETHDVDMVLDIQKLPFNEGEVAMFLTCSLPNRFHLDLFINTFKSLKTGGLLIIENQLPSDTEIALSIGFKPLLEAEYANKIYIQVYEKP